MITLKSPATIPGASTPETVRFEIDLREAGSLVLILKKPSYGSLLRDIELRDGYAGLRIQEAIIGWEGVMDGSDPPTPVPFSLAAFSQLCEAFPFIVLLVSNRLTRLYQGLGEDEAKN